MAYRYSRSSRLARILAVACFAAVVSAIASSSGVPVVPLWAPTYELNQSTFLYVCNYSGYTDVSADSVVQRFGLVAFDWSNNKGSLPTDVGVWANDHPMDSEADLVVQAHALKAVHPGARVFVYRNLVKALPWMGSVRRLLEDAEVAPSVFLGFDAAISQPHSPRCDTTFSPPRCSSLYHDQVQTPHYPNNSKYDGTCAAPCDCGGVPCGGEVGGEKEGGLPSALLPCAFPMQASTCGIIAMARFSASEAAATVYSLSSSVLQWNNAFTRVPDCSYIIDSYVMGPTGLGSGVIDGVSLDDGWFDVKQAGANDCTGSPVGGPTEVDSFCAVDMGLTQARAQDAGRGGRQRLLQVQGDRGGWDRFA